LEVSPQTKGKFSLQTILYILLAGAFIYFIIKYRDQLFKIVDVLNRGVWYITLIAIVVAGVAIYNQVRLYATIYGLLDLPNPEQELLPLYLVRRFVTVAAPSGGFSGWLPFIQFARRKELSVGAVFLANLIYSILWYSTFFIFLLIGLIFLFVSHDLQWFEVSAALIMLGADIAMIIGLILAWTSPIRLKQTLSWGAAGIHKVTDFLGRPAPVTVKQATTFADNLTAAVDRMRESRKREALLPVAHAFTNEALNLVMFFVVALAFGVHLNFGVLVAAYSVSILFFVVSPTPGGLGVVEGSIILVLTSLGVKPEEATVVTLAYRGIYFWLPFILGFGALRWFNQHLNGEAVSTET